MTRVKFCGLTRPREIEAVNRLRPDYVGFVFVPWSKRFLEISEARELRKGLHPSVKAVGVFVDASLKVVAEAAGEGIIDLVQLHGEEDGNYIDELRKLTSKPVIQAFRIEAEADVERARASRGDLILLDAGAGAGKTFDWSLIGSVGRPYFLAGGLDAENAGEAVGRLHPYGLDVSSGIETGGEKDEEKMAAFMAAVETWEQGKERGR